MLKSVYPIAIGTPSRINKLIELGALSLVQTTTIILDVSLDTKQAHLLSWPETKQDTYSLLQQSVVPVIGQMNISLIREVIPASNTSVEKKKPTANKRTWKQKK